MSEESPVRFVDLDLPTQVLKALDEVGYETPSPIQAACIPPLLAGSDVLGQAQTGTGKTAAFALPVLAQVDLKAKHPQVLVLAPTRELAIQVAEAFQKYASHMRGFHVVPIYGGQDYSTQLRQLKRGVQVVVGTPGRVMDHMRRGTLDLSKLTQLVLDEADEMLRMGFVDDVEWILEQTPEQRQIALFSATMPKQIKRIAQKYLQNPEEIIIKNKTATARTIEQKFWIVNGRHKLDALTRILEFETFDGMLIFVRTKTATVDVAEKLEARGYSAAAINGDIPQNRREKTIDRLKSGKIDILVATDVAARGLDVDRIDVVVNYDIPYDTESYVHRIGRTGRAGRTGKAILFVAPREKRMLNTIEKATRQRIELMEMPTTKDINNQRIERFKEKINQTLAAGDLSLYIEIMEQFQQAHDASGIEIAAALAKMAQGDQELLLQHQAHIEQPARDDRSEKGGRRDRKGRKRRDRDDEPKPKRERRKDRRDRSEGMDVYRIEVGREHDVKPKNIVGAIANEIDLDSAYIGHIDIHDSYSTVELPEHMPAKLLKKLEKVWVANEQLKISAIDQVAPKRAKAKSKSSTKSRSKDAPKTKGKRNAKKIAKMGESKSRKKKSGKKQK